MPKALNQCHDSKKGGKHYFELLFCFMLEIHKRHSSHCFLVTIFFIFFKTKFSIRVADAALLVKWQTNLSLKQANHIWPARNPLNKISPEANECIPTINLTNVQVGSS